MKQMQMVVALPNLAAPARAQTIAGERAREAWQRVPEIIAAMRIGPGSIVADVGAGYGFLTVRLAPVVGDTGKVYAVDSRRGRAPQLEAACRG
jgi:predicted methyltransferase